jgi:hypothetical protein
VGSSMISEIADVVTSIGVVTSLGFVAFQTRQLVKQTKIRNGLSSLAARYNSLERLHAVQSVLIDNPRLRPYFYSNEMFPDPSTEGGAQVLLVAEMIADAGDYGVMALEIMPSIKGYEGWRDFASFILDNSPAVRHVVNEHPKWYVELRRLASESAEIRPGTTLRGSSNADVAP